MSRAHDYYQERQPRPNDRYYQMLAQRQSIIDAWQQEDELKKNAEGAAAIEAEKGRQNSEYAAYAAAQFNPVKH